MTVTLRDLVIGCLDEVSTQHESVQRDLVIGCLVEVSTSHMTVTLRD